MTSSFQSKKIMNIPIAVVAVAIVIVTVSSWNFSKQIISADAFTILTKTNRYTAAARRTTRLDVLNIPESSSPRRVKQNKIYKNNEKLFNQSDVIITSNDLEDKFEVVNNNPDERIIIDRPLDELPALSEISLELQQLENDSFDEAAALSLQQSQEQSNTAPIGIWAARGILLLVAAIWGTNFASVKYLETLCFNPPCNHPPSEAAFARFGVAAGVSLPLLIGQRWDVIRAGLECGLFISFGYVSQAMALSTVSSSECAFICSLTVVVVPLLEALFLGKKVRGVNVASGVIAVLGVAMLEGMIDFQSLFNLGSTASSVADVPLKAAASAATSSDGSWFGGTLANMGLSKGDLLAMGQPIGFGISFMRIEHYVEKFKDVNSRILTITAAECVAVGLMSLFWVLIDHGGSLPNFGYMIEPHRLGAIAWTGIITTVVAIYLEGFALQKASATEAAITFASEPVWAALFATWLLNEQLSSNTMIGGAVILTACLISAAADLPGFSFDGMFGGADKKKEDNANGDAELLP